MDVIFRLLKVPCGKMGLRGVLGAGMGAKGVVKDQSVHSMGLVWREFCILAQWGFLFCFVTTHVLFIHFIYCKDAPVLHFSPLQVKVNHVMELRNMGLFLGLLAWLRTHSTIHLMIDVLLSTIGGVGGGSQRSQISLPGPPERTKTGGLPHLMT